MELGFRQMQHAIQANAGFILLKGITASHAQSRIKQG
jgi:hypothetical protein